VGRAGDIDRHKHRAHAQAGDIEHYRFQGLFDSNRNTIATGHAAPHQCGCETRGLFAQSLIAELSTRRGPEEQSVRVLARGVFDPVGRIDDGRRGGLRIHAHDRSGHHAIVHPDRRRHGGYNPRPRHRVQCALVPARADCPILE